MSVRLRERTLRSGKVQLFLDIYLDGKRQRESLALFLTPDRSKNAEIRKMANAIRAKRELQVHSGEYDIEPYRCTQCGICHECSDAAY